MFFRWSTSRVSSVSVTSKTILSGDIPAASTASTVERRQNAGS